MTKVPHIILASQSPRRRAMMEALQIACEYRTSAYEESHQSTDDPRMVVQRHARAKAASVRCEKDTDVVIIGADTVVSCNGYVYGKPRDMAEAREMLDTLSGQSHTVHTGVAVWMTRTDTWHVDACETRVRMRSLTVEERDAYLARVSPLDKAGAYAIQELGGIIIEHIEGCYYNVLGFPVAFLDALLNQEGISLLTGTR